MSATHSFSGTEAAHRAYMKSYMAKRRADKVRVNNLVRLAEHAPRIYGGQKELRDHSGTLMWPERVKDSATFGTEAKRLIDAAERRRKRGTSHG